MNETLKARCFLQKPYPPVRVEKENRMIARLLSGPYAGAGGELTAILTYLHGSIVTKDKDPKSLFELFDCIALQEMHHLEILGTLICLLGVNPVFAFDGKRPFSTAGMNYPTEPASIIAQALTDEKNAVMIYEKLISEIDDIYIKAVLQRIKEDEQRHWEVLSEFAGGKIKQSD